jgi:putative membrane protein
MIIFWAFVIFGVVWLVRSTGQTTKAPQPPDPERILQERLARGELDADDYRQRLDLLRGKVPVQTK